MIDFRKRIRRNAIAAALLTACLAPAAIADDGATTLGATLEGLWQDLLAIVTGTPADTPDAASGDTDEFLGTIIPGG